MQEKGFEVSFSVFFIGFPAFVKKLNDHTQTHKRTHTIYHLSSIYPSIRLSIHPFDTFPIKNGLKQEDPYLHCLSTLLRNMT
jgi:hypothetical protein